MPRPLFTALVIALLALSAPAPLPAQPATVGYATRLHLDPPVAAGPSVTVTGRGAPPGEGIWVELWRTPASGGPAASLGSVEATGGAFRFSGLSLAEGDALHATLSRSWSFDAPGDAEGWDAVVRDARLAVSGGVLRVEIQNLDGDEFTDPYLQSFFSFDPRYYRVVEVRLRNPAPREPTPLLGLFWGSPWGETIAEHNAEIPAAMDRFETVLIPMNAAETRIVPGPVTAGLDGLWDQGRLNTALRLDPLNNIPRGDRSLDGTVFEIDSIRLHEDYRREFHEPGDLEGLGWRNDVASLDVAGGFLSYHVADRGPDGAADGTLDPYLLGGLDTGRLDTAYFTRLVLGLDSSRVAADPLAAGVFFDDADSLGYRDDCAGGCPPGTTALQEGNTPLAPRGRHDVAVAMDAITSPAGEWSEDGRVASATLRLDIPQEAAAGDVVRIDYAGWVPDEPFGPSPAVLVSAPGPEIVACWDFSLGLQGWEGNAQTLNLAATPEGLAFESTGNDPWLTSPPVDPPAGRRLRVTIVLRSGADASGQLFYGRRFTEEESLRFPVTADGGWHDVVLLVPPQETGTRFRVDPAAAPGPVTVARFCVEALPEVAPPPLVPPRRPQPGSLPPLRVASGPLEVVHYRERWGGFAVRAGGVELASGHDAGRLGVIQGSSAAWQELGEAPVAVRLEGSELIEELAFTDAGGGRWTLRRRFRPGNLAGTIDADCQVTCDETRWVLHVPWLTLFPGLGTFGERKRQGLLAGLEYLEDEPSSSQADVTTDDHRRRVPAERKITFPLMALAQDGSYLGLLWERSERVAAVFDSPDRVFGSGAHLLALWAPAVGPLRPENELFAPGPFPLPAGVPAAARATLLGGPGESVVPAVQQYVALRGLPPVPVFPGGLEAAVDLLAAGWLDSEANAGGGLWRHAVWPGFGPQRASDAVVFMLWLAKKTSDPGLRNRLRAEARAALEERLEDDPAFLTGVSHVRPPVEPLVLGNVAGHVSSRRQSALGSRGEFDARGIRHYPQGGDDPRFGSTHFADHTAGYGARLLQSLLEAAALSGHPGLTADALRLLDLQDDLYANTVPRGAQTWEIPLHTPDLLAAAWVVKCYVLGYELTGEPRYLEEARYWAWTGVPFLYLDPSTSGEVGPYATIPVLGATSWVAPVWFGLPVQWVGLVYGAWLQRLGLHDPQGPWAQMARGITAVGLKMTWPRDDASRQGLLPDIFHLDTQSRAGPAINPGTVEATVAELFAAGSLYGFRRAESRGWFIHAPSAIDEFQESPRGVSFSLEGWGDDPYRLLVARVPDRPDEILVRDLDSGGAFAAVAFTHDAANDWLTVDLRGDAEVLVPLGSVASFTRGDANGDGRVDLADAVAVLVFLFAGRSEAVGCPDHGDADDNGRLELPDAVALLRFLFRRGRPPAPPYPGRGLDGTPDAYPCGDG